MAIKKDDRIERITPATVLQRLPDLKVEIESSDRCTILAEGLRIRCSPHGLAVLAAFSRPCSLSEALDALRPSIAGMQDWIDLTATIRDLWRFGILRGQAELPAAVRIPPSGYDAAPVHVRMLDDKARTEAFLAGIREVVRPGDTVVEIGTGTGILAIAAAQAGARRVYAIEAGTIGQSAAAAFAANGVADRVTLIPGWSTRVDLPERGDVLVSEMIGNEPLGERLVEVTADAVKRLLKPEARLIPCHIEIWGLPVTIPRKVLGRHTFQEETLRKWRSWYGVDLGPLRATARRTPQRFFINPFEAREWSALSDPVLLTDFDLRSARSPRIDSESPAAASVTGVLNGLLVYFEIELAPSVRLSTHPASARASNHWKCPVWVLSDDMPLKTGDELRVCARYGVAGSADCVEVRRGAGVPQVGRHPNRHSGTESK